MQPLRILLIDDHAAFRSGIGMLLTSSLPNTHVLEAGSLDEALHGRLEAPDLVVLDILLHGLTGIDGIALLRRKWPQAPVLMLSSEAMPETVRVAMARGAAAFVSKENSADALLAAICQVLDRSSAPRAAAATPVAPSLTPRQSEVLDLLCRGLPNKAIGRKLGLSENTVRWHVQAVLELLQVANRSEAAFAARRRGLIR